MSSVEQGGLLTSENDVFIRSAPGGAYVDPDGTTLTLTIKNPDGTTYATIPQAGLTRLAQGHWKYDWTVPIALPIGNYYWNWDARVAGAQLPTAVEEVVVVLAGALAAGGLLTVAQFREHVKSSLPDSAIQRLLDANTLAIVQRYGPLGEITETRFPSRTVYMYLDRPAAAISVIKEFYGDPVGISGITLTPTDYKIQQAGRRLERWGYGTNPADFWGGGYGDRGRVEITYTPLDDTAERQRALIKLVQLDLNREPGTSSIRMGDYVEQSRNEAYNEEREAILASLNPSGYFFA